MIGVWALIGKLGGWRRLGGQSWYWAGKLRRVGKECEIYIRGNVAESGGTTKRVSGVWVKLNRRLVHFQGTRNLEIKCLLLCWGYV